MIGHIYDKPWSIDFNRDCKMRVKFEALTIKKRARKAYHVFLCLEAGSNVWKKKIATPCFNVYTNL